MNCQAHNLSTKPKKWDVRENQRRTTMTLSMTRYFGDVKVFQKTINDNCVPKNWEKDGKWKNGNGRQTAEIVRQNTKTCPDDRSFGLRLHRRFTRWVCPVEPMRRAISILPENYVLCNLPAEHSPMRGFALSLARHASARISHSGWPIANGLSITGYSNNSDFHGVNREWESAVTI